MKNFWFNWKIVSFAFILIPGILIAVKIIVFDYQLDNIIPVKGYRLKLAIDTQNEKQEEIQIKTFAPVNNLKQAVLEEQGISDLFTFSVSDEKENRRILWQSGKIKGNNRMEYSVVVKSRHIKYNFNENTRLESYLPDSVKPYLKSSGDIQTDSPLIKKQLKKIIEGKLTLFERIKAIHKYIINDIKYINFSGILDAESCLTLGEGSCNGKSRLYVALAQNMGLPARLVGGIILNTSPKKMIHQWVEIYINGQWVPFCPTNDHFAELPKNYITLYYDDQVLFKHTSGIDFNYSYSFESQIIPEGNKDKKSVPFTIFNMIGQFEKFNLSLDIFIYLLMLPLAAFVSVILKNIIGLETFGTFLPILVASVLHNIGVFSGISVFFGIILAVFFLNNVISRLDLLYHPKMAILLSFVIFCLIAVFSLGLHFKIYNLVYVVFFPVAIVAITIHRVILLADEGSFKHLMVISLNTIAVILISFYFIHSAFLQLIMLSFPELIIALIGLNIMVGRWAGFRLTEYFRFAYLITEPKKQ